MSHADSVLSDQTWPAIGERLARARTFAEAFPAVGAEGEYDTSEQETALAAAARQTAEP